jgi:hypothetical protein
LKAEATALENRIWRLKIKMAAQLEDMLTTPFSGTFLPRGSSQIAMEASLVPLDWQVIRNGRSLRCWVAYL